MKHFPLALNPLLLSLLVAVPSAFTPQQALAWGEAHGAITRAAIRVLPAWQRDLLGKEAARLADYYCTLPDMAGRDKENARFAMMDSRPGEVYLLILHLPAQQSENLETLRYFVGKAVAAVKAGKTGDAARYMGTVCHMLEDYGCPAHVVPGDNMFTLLQQFLPPPERMKGTLLHGPIESGKLNVVVQGYRPRLLGTTADEAAWRLLHRAGEAILNARSTTIPIIQALYANDAKAVSAQQMKAATMDAKVVADAFYTILCIGSGKLDAAEQQSLRTVGIASFYPLEAVNLYFPQSEFFSSPYWGHAESGAVRLRVERDGRRVDKEFAEGIRAGMYKPLTFQLPAGVYRRFTVLAGLCPRRGADAKRAAESRVGFTIKGDSRQLATAILRGDQPAHRFDCDITGVTRLQLMIDARGSDVKSNDTVWAEPTVAKD
jgi:hypothetical protein